MGAVTYGYDAGGNRTTMVESGATTQYLYDPEHRLVRVNLPGGTYVAFAYDALGRRVRTRSSSGTVRLHWYKDEDRVLETDAGNAEKVRSTDGPGIDNPLKVRVSGNSYYFHEDGLGSIGYLTTSNKNTKITYRYDAFGRIVYQNQNGSISGYTNAWTYTGREWDAEINLYYYRARHYDPRTGRFLQVDPIPPRFDEMNAYVYVANNPIVRIDPRGWGWCEFKCGAKDFSYRYSCNIQHSVDYMNCKSDIIVDRRCFQRADQVFRNCIGDAERRYLDCLNDCLKDVPKWPPVVGQCH